MQVDSDHVAPARGSFGTSLAGDTNMTRPNHELPAFRPSRLPSGAAA
jgi:hypothetical protein